MPFAFASVNPLGIWRSLGLRLRGVCKFQVVLASSPFTVGASSYGFHIARPMWSCPFLRFGSNPALKPTRMLRAAYLVR